MKSIKVFTEIGGKGENVGINPSAILKVIPLANKTGCRLIFAFNPTSNAPSIFVDVEGPFDLVMAELNSHTD